MTIQQTRHIGDADDAYQRHVKPLEKAHRGEYVIVTPDGRTILAPTFVDAVQLAHKAPNKDNFIFKIGEKAVGKLR